MRSIGYNSTHSISAIFVPFAPRHQPVVLTDDDVRAMFARATVLLRDGIVPVEAEIIGWKRTSAGCLGAIVVNRLTGARFLFGPDLAKGGKVPRLLARLA